MKMIRKLIVASLMVMLALAMSACADKTERGELTGTLAEAMENTIVVNAGGDTTEFITGDSTVYYLGSTDHLCIDDEINVKYHKNGRKSYADVITLKKHKEETLTFSGTVTDAHDNRVTVTGNSLTVEFVIGSKTAIDGDLDKGDEVEVEYKGNLSEYPVAQSITVTKEKEAPKQQKVSGIVTDFTEKTMSVSIDSAHLYRFTYDSKTKVSGVDKYINVGDTVTVTFTGDVDKDPAAVEINITKKAEEKKKTITGTVKAFSNNQIVVDTGKTAYIIRTNKNTKFTGEKPAEGLKATITYQGNLNSKATATIVHCVKDETGKVTTYKVVFTDGMGNTLKTQKVEKGKSATAPSKPRRKGYTFNGWDKDFKKVTSNLTVNAKWSKNGSPEPEPKPTPEQPVTTEGTITHWTSDGNDTFGLKPADGDEITLAVGDFTDIAAGYMAEVGDVIKATYLKSDMKATKIELVSKVEKEDPQPQPDPEEEEVTPDPEKKEEPAPEPEPEPEKKEEVAPEPEPQEEAAPEPEPEPEPQEEAAPEPEPEPKPEPKPKKEEPPAEVIIKSGATIIEGDEKNKTAKLKLENGDTVTLNFNKNTKVASGYFPEKDDEVKITYEKNSMTLKEIQLVNRPAPEDGGGE